MEGGDSRVSTEIDNRIVEMEFRNNNFEKNAQTSMSTLDKLKDKLHFDTASTVFDKLADAANKVSFGTLGSSIELIASKFTNLGVIGVTALQNITNKAINAGEQLVKSLTIAPISQGFEEYELKMNSIQTMMMSTGASMEEVNSELDKLNTYADKTIYSFSDMTNNIGKFTNAGVKLKPAVQAIQGVANLAAVSGANAQQASHAMYNFGQALSSGFVKLIDWKSIENANMATVEFKQQLLDVALEMGTVTKTADGMYQTLTTDAKGHISSNFNALSMFNDSLSHQWMTTEVLTETLNRYADETTEIGKKAFEAAQSVKTFTQLIDTLKEAVGSGWAKSFEILFGNFEEAKELWTSLSKVVGGFIDQTSDARNELLQGWKDLGGRTELLNSLKNILSAVGDIIKPIIEGFNEIFPPATAARVESITKSFENFTKKLKITVSTSENIKNTAKGLFSVLSLGIQYISPIVKMGVHLASYILPGIGKVIISVTGYIGKLISVFDEIGKKTKIFDTIFGKLELLGGTLLAPFKRLLVLIGNMVDGFGSIDTGPVVSFINTLKDIFVKGINPILMFVNKISTGIIDIFEALFKKIETFGSLKTSGLSDFGKSIKDSILPAIDGLENALTKGGNIVEDFSKSVKNNIESFKGFDTSGIKKVSDDITNDFHPIQSIANFFKTAFDKIKEIIDKISPKISETLGGLWNEIKKLGSAFGTGLKTNNFGSFLDLLNTGLIGVVLLKIKSLTDVFKGFKKDTKGLIDSIKSIFSGLQGVLEAFQTSIKANALIKIAVALGIMAISLAGLSQIPRDELIDSLSAVTILLGGMMASMRGINPYVQGEKSAPLMKLAFSILAITTAIKMLSSIDPNIMWSAVGAIVVLMAAITAMSKLMNKTSSNVKGLSVSVTNNINPIASLGAAILAVSIAMLALLIPIKILGNMDTDKLIKGLAGTIIMLGALAGALKLFSMAGKGGGLEDIGKHLIAIAFAMDLLCIPIALIASLDIVSAIIAIAAVPAMLTGMALAIKLFPKPAKVQRLAKSMILLSTAFVIFSTGVLLLIPSIAILSGMIKMGMGDGLAILAVGFVVLAGAAVVLAKSAKYMGKAAAGLFVLSAAFTLLAAGIVGISIFADLIIKSGDKMVQAIITIIEAASKAIRGTTYLIVDAVLALVEGLLRALRDETPRIVEDIFEILIRALRMLDKYIPALTSVAMEVLQHLFDNIAKAFSSGEINPAAIATVLLSIAGLVILFEKIKEASKDGTKAIKGAALIAAASAIIGFALGTIANLVVGTDWQATISAMVGMSLITLAFSKLMPSIAKAGEESKKAITGSVVIAAAVAAIGLAFVGILALAQGINMSAVVPFVISMIATVVAIGTLVTVMSLLKIDPQVAAYAGAGLVVFITIIGAFMAALGGLLTLFPDIQGILEQGITVFRLIGEGIGSIIGGLIAGIGKGVLEIVPAIGQALSDFMTNLQGFIEGVKKIDGNVLKGVLILAATILVIAAAEFVNQIVSFLNFGADPIYKFINQMLVLAPAIVDFADEMEKINDPAKLEAGAAAAQMIGNFISALPKEGGLFQKITGTVDLEKFSSQLPGLGTNLKDFSLNAEGLKEASVQKAVFAAKMIGSFIDGFKGIRTGGVAGFLQGDVNIQHFAAWLPELGTALKKFSENSEGLKTENVEPAVAAGKMIGGFIDGFNGIRTGGIWQQIVGEVDLEGFSTQLPKLGANLRAFSINANGIKMEDAEKAATVGTMIANLANTLPKEGGWWQDLTGEKMGLEEFGNALASLGNSLLTYSNYAALIDADKASKATSIIATLASIGNVLNSDSGSKLKTFAEQLGNFGDFGIQSFIDNFNSSKEELSLAFNGLFDIIVTLMDTRKEDVSKKSEEITNKVKEKLTPAEDKVKEIGKKWIRYFTQGLLDETEYANMKAAVEAPITEINNIQNNETSQQICRNTGLLILGWIKNGMIANTGAISTAADNIVDTIYTRITSNSSKIINAGNQISAGLSRGMTSSNSKNAVVNSSIKMANYAIAAAASAFEINSPSRVFTRIAEQCWTGYSIGSQKSIKQVTQSSRNTARASMDAAKEEFQNSESQNGMKRAFVDVIKNAGSSVDVSKVLGNNSDWYKNGFDKGNSMLSGIDDSMIGIDSAMGDYINSISGELNSSEMQNLINTAENKASEAGSSSGEAYGNSFNQSASMAIASTGSEIDQLAQAVIRGNWGNGLERIQRLTEAGYDYKTVQNRVNEMLGIIKTSVKSASSEMDITPIITPVLDTTKVQEGANNVSDLLFTATGETSPTYEITSQTTSKQLATDIITNDTQNYTEIIKELEKIRDDLMDFADAATSQKMVLDTGTLVGEITPKIDSALAQRASYAERGN